MPPSLSISNILQALYENSPTIKMYVDCIASGRPAPFTLITKSTEHEKNEEIVARLRYEIDDNVNPDTVLLLKEIMDEAMILEEEDYDIIMFKDDAIVEGSRQTVEAEKLEILKEYARFKGYTISIKKHDTL